MFVFNSTSLTASFHCGVREVQGFRDVAQDPTATWSLGPRPPFHCPHCHSCCPGSDFTTLSLIALSGSGGESHHLAPKIVMGIRSDAAKEDALGKRQGPGLLRHPLELWCLFGGRMAQAGCPNPSSPLALPQISFVSPDGWLNLSGPLSDKEMA